MKRNICIIPARGGSKRIPRKNIKNFLGKPIITYSIEVAQACGLFEEIMVSTDDEEIAEVALKFGAKVPFMRNPKTANDYATLADVIEEVKNEYLKLGRVYDYICCILPTAPLISIDSLKKGFELLIEEKADSVRPVVRFLYPIQRAFKLNNGRINMFYPEYQRTRSQDLEPAYHDAGQFYWMKALKGLMGAERFAFIIPDMQAQDIDILEDWSLLEMKYQILHKKV